MPRSIPPRTMRDVCGEISKQRPNRKKTRSGTSLGQGGGLGSGRRLRSDQNRSSPETRFSTGLLEKPRNWRFQTKPLFKKFRGPLVDVFHEAEEVLIVIDLGGFRRGDVSLTMTPERYIIDARRGDQKFRQEIALPPEADIENSAEHYRNGILEIILPRKKGAGS